MSRTSTDSTDVNSTNPPSTTARGGGAVMMLVALVLGGLLLLRNGEAWLRTLLLYLARAGWARALMTRFGPAWLVAKRFVAGETVDEAIHAARELNARGMRVTLDFLGESVAEVAEANAACEQILYLLDRMETTGIDANVSLKLSQLGLKLDENLAVHNLRRVLERARQYGRRVRIDMEESAVVDVTLDIYRRLRQGEGFDNVGVVSQSALYRSEEDVRLLVQAGAWVRLVKGAYKEPVDVAYADKADVDASFVRLVEMMLSEEARTNGVYLAVATHDDKMIEATQRYAHQHSIPSDAYEFQLLYGIRRERQAELVQQGYKVRVYVPYGAAWYPYFMRRLAERPANLWFFVTSFFKA